MSISRSVAKRLCTDAEFLLGNESFPPHINHLTSKELQARIRRARNLRDKQRGLAEKQAREMSGRVKPTRSKRAAGNHNTRLKQQFFDETLARFEKRLATLVEKAETPKKATVAKAPAKKKAVSLPAKDMEKRNTKRVAKASNMRNASQPASRDFKVLDVKPHLPAMRGAASAANKRFQKKRDSR